MHHVWMCTDAYAIHGGQRTISQSVLSFCCVGFQGSNLGYQTWQQMPFFTGWAISMALLCSNEKFFLKILSCLEVIIHKGFQTCSREGSMENYESSQRLLRRLQEAES